MRNIISVIIVSFIFAACDRSIAAPVVVTERSILYVSGGIGNDEVKKLQAMENLFNLKLLFTLVEGNYLADIGVMIADASNKVVVKDTAQGPFFLAKLPPGRYVVSADYDGKSVRRLVTVSDGRLHTEYFRWVRNPEVDVVVGFLTTQQFSE